MRAVMPGETTRAALQVGRPTNFQLWDKKNPGDHPETAEDYFRSIYFEMLDLVINFILDRFNQPEYKLYSSLESLFVGDFSKDLDSVCDFYGDDLERNSLLPQLQTLRVSGTGAHITQSSICLVLS